MWRRVQHNRSSSYTSRFWRGGPFGPSRLSPHDYGCRGVSLARRNGTTLAGCKDRLRLKMASSSRRRRTIDSNASERLGDELGFAVCCDEKRLAFDQLNKVSFRKRDEL